jgi:hypothetical protein
MKHLIYVCVFYQKGYINLLELLTHSIMKRGHINPATTDILIMTSPEFKPLIKDTLEYLEFNFQYHILPLKTMMEAACCRLNIFDYEHIEKYDTILYLDTDVLINSDVNVLFQQKIATDKLYALEEGDIECGYFGGERYFDFSKIDKKTPGFSSGVLYFCNSPEMRSLFSLIKAHIHDDIYVKKNSIDTCMDQPFIVFNAINEKKYDNQFLKPYVEMKPTALTKERIIYHFSGGPGKYMDKIMYMRHFLKMMLNES